MHGCHDDLGYLGTEHMLDLLCNSFYWPNMQDEVDQHHWPCDRCTQFKACPQCEELYHILTTYPLELVHIDGLMIEDPKPGKDVNILVITDHFTQYTQMIVTTSQAARVTARALWDGLFTHHGFPASILSDQGHNLKSSLIKELCDLAGMDKIHTTSLPSTGNGQCEWFNPTIINMIGMLQDKDKTHWWDFVPTLVHAYNYTKSSATKFSPYYLMFGWKPWLGLHLQFGLQTEDKLHQAYHDYVS